MSGFGADTTSYYTPYKFGQGFSWDCLPNQSGSTMPMPWMQNSMPVFNPTFSADSLMNWNPGVCGWGSCNSSYPSSSSNSSTLEEMQEKERKNVVLEEKKFFKLKQEEKEVKKSLEKENQSLKKIEESKLKDGSANLVKDFKDLTNGEKIKIAAFNAFKGIGNVCKSIVGVEADGSFNLKKCIRNIAIAAGTAVVCYFAAPVVAAAAIALGASTAVAATCATVASGAVTTLTYAGLAAGVVKTGKGVYDAVQADTTEEFDKATQDIGQGAFIALASRAGLKGSAKAAGVLSKVPAGSSMFSKFGASVKNVLVNPWKAARVQGVAASRGAQRAVAQTGATSIIGRISNWCSSKTGWYRVLAARQSVKNISVATSRKQFVEAFNNTKTSIENRIAKIEAELNSATSNAKKATLDHERNGLYEILDKLDNVKTHGDWRSLRKFAAQAAKDTGKMRGKWYTRPFTRDKEITIDSHNFKRADLLDDLKKVRAEQKAVAAEIQQLTRLRMESMSQMAKMSSSSTLSRNVSDFGFSSKWYAKPLNWAKTKWDCGMSTFEKIMGGMNISFIAMEPWWALQPIVRQTYMMPVNGLTLFHDPVLDKPEGELISAADVTNLEQKYKMEIKKLKQQKMSIEAKLEAFNA